MGWKTLGKNTTRDQKYHLGTKFTCLAFQELGEKLPPQIQEEMM